MVERVADIGGMDAAVDLRIAKHMVDRLQDRRPGTERIGERHRIEFQPGILEFLLQCPAAQVEFVRRGALKRKDRLLLVADREDGAHHAVARALAGGEFGNDMDDDVPLPRAGILRLVDQHMVDAAIELVMHPARRDALKHVQRLVDQIVIVEQAAFQLLAPVIRRRGGGDVQQRLGAVAGRQRAAPLDQRADADAFRLERARHCRMVVAELLCQHRLPRRPIVGEKHAEIFIHLCSSGKSQRVAEPFRMVLFGLAAAIEPRGDVLPARLRQVWPVDDLALDGFDSVIGIDAESCRQLRRGGRRAAGIVGPRHEMIAAETGFAHHILEGDVGGAGHRDVQRASGRAAGVARCLQQHREVGALHHLGLVALVEHRKPRRHVGLERELLQQSGAECVDGLHLQSARGFQRTGKQLAGAHPQVRVRACQPDVADRGVERGVVERDPMAERGEDPLGHVGRRRLGEGDAEDLLRWHAPQQQPDHPLHQHMGLAGAGIGRDKRGSRGVGRARLGGANGVGDLARYSHHSSIPSPPAADHSLMRARSS